MEEGLVKLIKVVMEATKEACEEGCSSDKLVDAILHRAELKLHDEAVQDLKEFAKNL